MTSLSSFTKIVVCATCVISLLLQIRYMQNMISTNNKDCNLLRPFVFNESYTSPLLLYDSSFVRDRNNAMMTAAAPFDDDGDDSSSSDEWIGTILSRKKTTKKKRRKKVNTELMEVVMNLPLGWDDRRPQVVKLRQYLKLLCPDVVEHFTKFPSFAELPQLNHSKWQYPFSTTDYAAQGVCTLHIAQMVAASINAKIYLYAGAHLGAILHGQPIPWDDDIDAVTEFSVIEELYKLCSEELTTGGLQVHPDVTFVCVKGDDALKLFLKIKGMTKMTRNFKHWSPFVDLFSYLIRDDGKRTMEEYSKTGENNYTFNVRKFFPTRPYYFGGIHVLGPSKVLAEERYDMEACKIGRWNHRLENLYSEELYNLDCDTLRKKKKLPFVLQAAGSSSKKDYYVSNNNNSKIFVYPEIGDTEMNNISRSLIDRTTVQQRQEWYEETDPRKGQIFTNGLLPHLNHVDADNTIAVNDNQRCTTATTKLRVVEYNAERGRWWLLSSESLAVLRDADVILLNEMDIGMARSDQQHTARQMAYFLKMNYVWGLEFIELTHGTQHEQNINATNTVDNFYGFHGNAILSRCPISDPVIFRDPIGSYYSNKTTHVNANGYEKRLGGRMLLLGRIHLEQKKENDDDSDSSSTKKTIVVGSIHTLWQFKVDQKMVEGIQKYIRSSGGSDDNNNITTSVVIAGDQQPTFCDVVGLKSIKGGNTWPASCSGYGWIRGDNICTNMIEIEKEQTTLPCIDNTKFRTSTTTGNNNQKSSSGVDNVVLGDHALTSVVLQI